MNHTGMKFRITSLGLLAILAPGLPAQAPPAPAPAVPPTGSTPTQPQSELRRALQWRRLDYSCEAGATVRVLLRNDTVRVTFKGKSYALRQVLSANGARYSDGKVLWWSVGDGGFLQQDGPDGNGTMIAKNCKLDRPAKRPLAGTTSER